MAWPTTQATTTHLDSETDDPNQARPEIKLNIENVNSIIDFIPNGIVGSEPAYFSFGSSIPLIATATGVGYNDVTNTFTLITAGGTGISVNASNTYKLDMPAGSYFIELLGRGSYKINQSVVGRNHNIKLVKEISASDTDIQEIFCGNASSLNGFTGIYKVEGGSDPDDYTDYFRPSNFITTAVYGGAGTLRMQHDSSAFTGTLGDTPAITYDNNITFKITKYA